MKPVVVFETFDLAQAQLIRSKLTASGIQALVQHDQSTGVIDAGSKGVRVVVPPGQAAEAARLIEAGQKSHG